MIDLQLFLGFPVDYECKLHLDNLKPDLKAYFLRQNSEYLEKHILMDVLYLGKKIGKDIDLEKLKELEVHVYSILKRLLPEYPFHEKSLVLFPINEHLS